MNATNTPKMYLVGFTLLLFIIMLMFKNRINVTGIYNEKKLLYGIFVICIIQALYGLCQLWDLYPSHNSRFAITGSFDNRAGFAALLAMGFPIGLFLLTKTGNAERAVRWRVNCNYCISISLRLKSRFVVNCCFIGSFLYISKELIRKFKQFRHYRLLMVLLLAVLTTGGTLLYFQKKILQMAGYDLESLI